MSFTEPQEQKNNISHYFSVFQFFLSLLTEKEINSFLYSKDQ